jgi:hypothetical protein
MEAIMPAGRPKGSGGTNKSALIRDYIKANPEATTNQIVEALGSKGHDVSQALVAGVRSREHRGPGNKSRRGEITINELNTIHTIVEKFEDASIVMGIIQDLTLCIKQIGGMDRFEEAMKAYSTWKPIDGSTAEMMESSSSEEDMDSDSDSDDEDEDEDD